ncbi:transglutaminase family protein, partial [Frankia sp. AgPm24]|uniref:transglutaminase-like domain-containing protein n=1 Tax=Frankia sp. AgPm24 TaxID=631128 RepID=UPI00201017E6
MTDPHTASGRPSDPFDGRPTERVISCDLTFEVSEPAEIAVQIAAAGGRVIRDEHLMITAGHEVRPAPTEWAAPHRGRVHVLRAEPGLVSVSYRAELGAVLVPPAPPVPLASAGSAGSAALPGLEQLTYLRASRYCPSDQLVGFAVAEFGELPPGRPRVEAITDWIHRRVGYVPGASNVHSGATEALLTGQGVCRDFAHLGAALCRALQIPARFVAVYAPGLTPMDFHAVFEAWFDGAWWTYDATRHAPRHSLVRGGAGGGGPPPPRRRAEGLGLSGQLDEHGIRRRGRLD